MHQSYDPKVMEKSGAKHYCALPGLVNPIEVLPEERRQAALIFGPMISPELEQYYVRILQEQSSGTHQLVEINEGE